METLKALSNDMATLVEQLSASVVRVEGRKRLPATGVVMAADGVIVTSNHVVTRDEGVRVGLADGTIVEAELVGRDPSTDLAVLKAEASDLVVPVWTDTTEAKVGELVLALGRPGRSVQATLGVMSALGGAWQIHGGGKLDRYVQTDVTMYPGFSGGALVGADGAVYGLNTSALMRGTSLAIPTETVKRVGADLMEHGHIKRGYIGVTAQTVRLQASVAEQVGQETGLLVSVVEAGAPAEAGGVYQGDIIVKLDDTPLTTMDSLLMALSSGMVGKAVALTVIRGGDTVTLDVTVGERA
jgi:S1-C subfamily serine protease